jgi:phosphatidylglycerophosphatase A
VSRLVATVLGLGHLRPGPGTWGSLAGLLLAYVVLSVAGAWALVALGVAVWAAGLAAARQVVAESGESDPAWIVIDEVVGQWIALLPVAYGVERMSADPLDLWPGWVAAFLLFRLFDVWKPWLAGRADRRGDALGLMLDDVWAGVFAAIGVILLAGLAHGALMR